MSDLYTTLFSPLGKEYCDYFKYLMIISFIMLIGTILGCLYDAFSKKPLFGMQQYLFSILNSGVIYFVNRLMFSICVN